MSADSGVKEDKKVEFYVHINGRIYLIREDVWRKCEGYIPLIEAYLGIRL